MFVHMEELEDRVEVEDESYIEEDAIIILRRRTTKIRSSEEVVYEDD